MSEHDREKWDAKWATREQASPPSTWLVSLADRLPQQGRALDIAGGAGRNALWLVERGLQVTVYDVSEVGLAAARRFSNDRIATVCCDLEVEPLPDGPWDVILSFHYLQRALFSRFPALLAPDGLLVFCQPTALNLSRHPHPSRRFLLREGELAGLIPAGLETLSLDESWGIEGRHEARLVARKSRNFEGA